MLATDDYGIPKPGNRELYLSKVQGDFTAWIHVESGMGLNIDFNETAILSFSIAVYEVSCKKTSNVSCTLLFAFKIRQQTVKLTNFVETGYNFLTGHDNFPFNSQSIKVYF